MGFYPVRAVGPDAGTASRAPTCDDRRLAPLVLSRVQQHGHERVHALAAVAEADDVQPVHVLVDLALADGEQFAVALAQLPFARAAAEQDGKRLSGLATAREAGLRGTGAEVALHAVEVRVDLVAPLGLRLHDVLH